MHRPPDNAVCTEAHGDERAASESFVVANRRHAFRPRGVGGAARQSGCVPLARGRRNEKKKLGVSNTPYDGGRWVTNGGWWSTDGGWCVTDGGWWVTDGGWCVTDGGWQVTDGGWWVATKHQRVDAI